MTHSHYKSICLFFGHSCWKNFTILRNWSWSHINCFVAWFLFPIHLAIIFLDIMWNDLPTAQQSLVKRDEIILGFDIIDNWDIYLNEMNKDKAGQPYYYPNIFLSSSPRICYNILSQSYRQTKEGIALRIAKSPTSIPHYTTQ